MKIPDNYLRRSLEEVVFAHRRGGKTSPAGFHDLVLRSTAPIWSPFASFRRALRLEGKVELPPLIVQTLDEMAIGLEKTYATMSSALSSSVGRDLSFVDSDSDVHPDYKFSAVLEAKTGTRIAVKFRSPSAEHFLRDLLERLSMSGSVYVPTISELNSGMISQEYVNRAATKERRGKQFWLDMGRLVALCDLLGLNDMHVENVLFDGERLAIVDGETMFQDNFRDSDPELNVLRSHLLYPHGNVTDSFLAAPLPIYVAGCLTEAIASEADHHEGLLDDVGIINSVLEGYLTWRDVARQAVNALPEQLIVRRVRFPTVVYGELLSSSARQAYHQDREEMSGHLLARMNALWPADYKMNSREAVALSYCQIPFHNRIVLDNEAKQAIESVSNKIEADIPDRIAKLRGAAWSAIRSVRRDT